MDWAYHPWACTPGVAANAALTKGRSGMPGMSQSPGGGALGNILRGPYACGCELLVASQISEGNQGTGTPVFAIVVEQDQE